MKNISENLKNSLNKNSLNIVKCYNIFLKSGEKLYFTQNSNNIIFDNNTYIPNNGIEGNIINNGINLEIENTDIKGFIDSETINHNDILSGKFDNAEIEIFLLDLNLNEKVSIFNGYIANISYQNNIFIANIKNKTLLLEKIIGDTYSPLCRCCFCDKKCGLNKDNYTIKGVISEIINQLEFNTNTEKIINKDNNYFTNGIIKMINGKNNGITTEVKKSVNNYIGLKFKFPFEINVGDQFEIIAGCDKEFYTCCSKFDNAINFRGEPNLPRSEKVFKIY